MTLYDLKPRFQALLRPYAGELARRGVTANQVTLAALAGSIAIGLVLSASAPVYPLVFLLLPIWLLARMALNAIDGMLAREHGQKSDLGAYLNELSDVASDFALILPFALLHGAWSLVVVVVALLAALSEMAGALGPAIGASRRYDGPMGKSDRAFALGVLAAWIAFAGGFSTLSSIALLAIAALVALTVANRVRAGLVEAGSRRGGGERGSSEDLAQP